MTQAWIAILLASLGGSLHCAAMCGPFMAAAASFGPDGRAGGAIQAAYHLGSLLTYLAFGAAGGFLGGALDLAGDVAGIGRISAFAAGAMLVFAGLSALAARTGQFVPIRRRAPRRLGAWLGDVLTRIRRFPPISRAFLLGLSTTLVPCGWLYAFVATAAGTGHAVSGLYVMLVFWLGTVPALFAAGVGLRGVFARLGRHARTLSAALIVASGVAVLALRASAEALPAPAARPGTAVPSAGSVDCPLHRH